MADIPIIGLGAVCCAGVGVDAGWKAVGSGTDGLTELDTLDTGLKQSALCGQVRDDLRSMLGFELPNRTLMMAMVAAKQAMSGVSTNRAALRLGVVGATTVAGMTRSEVFYKNLLADSSAASGALAELSHHEPATMTAEIARAFDAQLMLTASTACSTGLHAVGMAARLIERGQVDLCLAVGADALSILTVRGFASLTLLAPGGCRPFDKNRAGISLGEGAGAMVLASPSAAKALALSPVARFRGWGSSADCHHMTAPHPEGKGASSAMRAAITESGLDVSSIGFVAAHGTGTPDNDIAEVRAIREVFGRTPPFVSMKRSLGHTLGASGTLEAVFAIRALSEGRVPPSGGFSELDEAIGVAPSAGEPLKAPHVIKNAFGFGGNNACAVFSGVHA